MSVAGGRDHSQLWKMEMLHILLPNSRDSQDKECDQMCPGQTLIQKPEFSRTEALSPLTRVMSSYLPGAKTCPKQWAALSYFRGYSA